MPTEGEATDSVFKMLIGGKWVASSSKELMPVVSPIDGEVIAKVQKGTKKDAEKAVKAAVAAKKTIGTMPAVDRAEILRNAGELIYEFSEELIETICLDAGKPYSVAKGEIEATAERFLYAAEEAKQITGESLLGDTVPWHKEKIGMVIRQPIGVVLAICPFNYPLFIASAKIAPALAAGNSVIAKPASDDPLALLFLAEILELAGLPSGALNVITGPGAEIGDYLSSHPDIDMISFTGSTRVGKAIAKNASMQKLHLELGGKSPALVLADADLELAAKQCASGAFKFSGQRCDAISRILVDKSVAAKLTKLILKEAKGYTMGDPLDEKTKIGPLINERAIAKVESLVADAKKKGAKVLCGGKRETSFGKLYYVPTVLSGVTPKMKIAWEETFGPVAAIMSVSGYEEMIELSNKSEYGLDASVFTNDINKAIDAGLRLEDGTVNINAAPAHGLGNFPFGGDKDSGMDREGIKFSVDDMTKAHTIIFNPKKP